MVTDPANDSSYFLLRRSIDKTHTQGRRHWQVRHGKWYLPNGQESNPKADARSSC